jgi:hypothetical protein
MPSNGGRVVRVIGFKRAIAGANVAVIPAIRVIPSEVVEKHEREHLGGVGF